MAQRSEPKPPADDGARTDARATKVVTGAVIDGRYRVLSPLGEGGMGTVLIAEHVELGRRVALKVLQERVGDDPTMRKRFQREAKTLATMSHPNIVALNDYGIWEGTPYLVMELLEGRTLRDLLDAERVLPLRRALVIAQQILRALSYAHGLGVIHRDLKPGNVFLQALPDDVDHVKLLDFGFAKFVNQASSSMVSSDGIVLGTPAYMAPEQAGGTVDHRADVYASAVLIFEMLSGRRPFEGEPLEMLRARLVADPPRLGEVLRDVDVAPELEEALSRALSRRPVDRTESAAELSRALAKLGPDAIATRAKGAKPSAKKPPTTKATTQELGSKDLGRVRPPAPRRRRRRSVSPLWALLALVSLAGLALAGWRATPWGAEHDPLEMLRETWSAGAPPASVPEVIEEAPALEPSPAIDDDAIVQAPPPAPAPEVTEPLELPTDVPPLEPPPVIDLAAAALVEAPPVDPALEAIAPDEAAALVAEEPAPVVAEVAPADEVEPVIAEPAPVADESEPIADAPSEAPSADVIEDPWTRPIPTELAALRARVLDAPALPAPIDLRRVASYARQDPSDARAIVLLAHGYVRIRWMAEALERYEEAHRIDASLRGDPLMQQNLVALSTSPVVGARASALVTSIYGREALVVIDAALASPTLDERGRAQLSALRDAIAALP
ncbi:serine/threonine-protein kinase [Sandaracinus amylolyticus]|uniref:Serine/threonine protein kinase n=1 Tax=Sandaracinus amylolyticus TaxID=927083 RepID=A0A0F6YH80_9BACT|nr:serine/threonine-protein kinase [Sandaracinus amylolyticus]AKF04463.1 serine/threonine protein kinase [Sandaracinus amylolyticus]